MVREFLLFTSFPILDYSFQKQQEGSFAPRIFKPHKPFQTPFDIPQLPSISQKLSSTCFASRRHEVQQFSMERCTLPLRELMDGSQSRTKGSQFCFEFSLVTPTIKCKKVVMQPRLGSGWGFHSFFLDNSMRNRLNIPNSALCLFLQEPESVRLFSKTNAILPNVHSKFPKIVEVI